MKTIKVLDTNIILLDANNVLTLGSTPNTTIVLSETVIDELDNKKSGHSEIAYQAREFGRILAKAEAIDTFKEDGVIYSIFNYNGVTIFILSMDSYPDFKETEPAIRNDRKIIYIAQSLARTSDKDSKVIFYSNDVMCRIRASSLGLEVSDIKDVEDTDFEFTKTLEVDLETFNTLHNKHIVDIDQEHKPENKNYKFISTETSQVKLATITVNDTVDIIGKTTEKELRRQDISPKNADQLLLAQAIQDLSKNVIVVEARSGTGKSSAAISNAMKLIKTNNHYTSIIYIRASVDDVDDVEAMGFIAGNDEKIAVYSHPLYDTLDFIARSRNKDSKLKGVEYEKKIEDTIDDIINKYNIQFMTTLGLRGRTLTDAIVIVDEVQNQSKASLVKVLTRLKDCKLILLGSNRQIDNKYLTKYTNGLSVVLNDCAKADTVVPLHVVPLYKVERSKIAEWAEQLFEKENK